VRQARCLAAAGAREVLAVVNSETAAAIARAPLILPDSLKLVVRDTANSMETLFEIGSRMPAGWFLATTVDAVLPIAELAGFAVLAQERIARVAQRGPGAVLGVVRWRGDERPLFVDVSRTGVIEQVGAETGEMVTAGIYFFSTRIFSYQARARQERLGALRQFLAGLLRWGVSLEAIEVQNVIDIDEAADLKAAERMLQRFETGR